MTTSKGGKPATGSVNTAESPKPTARGRSCRSIRRYPRATGKQRCNARISTATWYRANPHVDVAPGETSGEWFKRFYA
jgi:hypothetical protein